VPVGTRGLSRKLHLCVGVSRLVTHIFSVILASSVLLLLFNLYTYMYNHGKEE
jgi:hypothetical protein